LIAAQNGHSTVVQLLIESGATCTKGALSAAAQHGHVRVVAMLASPEALAEHDDDGDTALCKSAKAGHEGATNALISAGADVDASSSDGTTPLYWATRFGNLRVIAALLAAGASIEMVEAAQMRGREAGRRIPFGGMHTVMAGG
jgi:ankyrin repeat protein